MGHTLPTITGHFDRFQSQIGAFRRALRRHDQLALNELVGEIKQHTPAASYAAHVLPSVMFLLSGLLEKHKQLKRHEAEFDILRQEFRREMQQLRDEFKIEQAKLRLEYFRRGLEYASREP